MYQNRRGPVGPQVSVPPGRFTRGESVPYGALLQRHAAIGGSARQWVGTALFWLRPRRDLFMTISKWLTVLLLLNAAYVAGLPSATIFYAGNVLLHVLLGIAGVVVLFWQWRRSHPKAAKPTLLVAAALLGGFLLVRGAVTDNRWALWAHIALAIAALAMLLPPGRWRAGLGVLVLTAGALRLG